MRKNWNKFEKTGIEPSVKYLTAACIQRETHKQDCKIREDNKIYQCDSQSVSRTRVLSLKKLFLNCHIQTRLPHNAAVQRAPRPTSLVCEFAETTMLIGELRWPDDEE